MKESRQLQPTLPPVPSTSKRLFLVRHGEVINPGGKDRPVFYGGADVPLSDLGRLEAQAAAQYLSQHPLMCIFSSPLSRALYGARRIQDQQQQQQQQQNQSLLDAMVIVPDFSELNRGAWCGKTHDEIGEALLMRFDACDESVTPEGGESFPALKHRVITALRNQVMLQLPLGATACIVSHLQVTRCLVSDALRIPTDQMVRLKMATASVTCIDYNYESDVTNKYNEEVNDKDVASPFTATVHFQSFKPSVGLQESMDRAN